ncbi:MAG: hypothetical protein JWO78_1130 [Micavibrio sp.]|nr:hypothetical protein [Micavibrio sp.]
MHNITVYDHKIPALGFGTWKLSGADCVRAVGLALDIGYRHIDTAQVYENESDVGTALQSSGVPRKDIFLTTKIWMDNVRDGDLQKSAEKSLKKLKTDYVDLLLLHWPVHDVPLQEQLAALRAVQKSGQAKLIGVSNYTVAQMREAVEDLSAPIVANQVEYHPFISQKSVLDYARKNGLVLTAYSPLARGKVNDVPLLQELARQYGKNPGQIALRWLMQQDHVAAIPKAASEQHIRDNFNIFDFVLNEAQMQAISDLARPDGRLVNPQWAPQWDKVA